MHKNINELIWSDVVALTEQAPFLFELNNETDEKSKNFIDAQEDYFNENFSSANDLQKKEILRKIENESKLFLDEQENKKKIKLAKHLLEKSYIPKNRFNNTLDNFIDNTEVLKKAKTRAKEYILELENNSKNLIISGYGDVGTGKTHLAIAIAKEIIKNQLSVVFINSTSMFATMRKDFNINPYIDTDVLIIDDLGKENKTSWVMEQLYIILNERYNRNKSVIITTENTLDYLEEHFENQGKALISRLCENYVLIKCTGKDYRLN